MLDGSTLYDALEDTERGERRHDDAVERAKAAEARVEELEAKLASTLGLLDAATKGLTTMQAERDLAQAMHEEASRQRDAIGEELIWVRGSQAELLAVAEASAKDCRCRGTGSYERACTLCGDSTYDHNCNDETRPCTDAVCIQRRTAIANGRKS